MLEKLGQGGMGEVWRAKDTSLQRQIALKFLLADAGENSVQRQRFEQEARAAAALSHPCIATVHELAGSGDQIFIVFEYVPGTTLRSSVSPGGVSTEELLGIAVDVAGGGSLTLNCGYGHGFSVLEVIDTVKRVSGVDFRVEFAPPKVAADKLTLRCTLGNGKPLEVPLKRVLLVKAHEWYSLVSAGQTVQRNNFYMFYYAFTGVHLFHVLMGLIVLGVMRAELRRPAGRRTWLIEAGAIYWHMVDLLWIILFALLYLLR